MRLLSVPLEPRVDLGGKRGGKSGYMGLLRILSYFATNHMIMMFSPHALFSMVCVRNPLNTLLSEMNVSNSGLCGVWASAATSRIPWSTFFQLPRESKNDSIHRKNFPSSVPDLNTKSFHERSKIRIR